MQDITPLIDSKIKVIESYGAGGFKISGQKVEGNIAIYKNNFFDIDDVSLSEISKENINTINLEEVEILIVGSGESSDFLNNKTEQFLKSKSVKIEYMNTGAAARTYNVLITEERNVAALLIAV